MDDISAFFAAAGIDETPELREAFAHAVMAVLRNDPSGVSRIVGNGNARSSALGSS